MKMELNISLLLVISVFAVVDSRLFIDRETSKTFDRDLYERVLDAEECERQMDYLQLNSTSLYGRFLDSGTRTPRSIFMLGTTDLGDYHQCLGIVEHPANMTIEGKYCFLEVPLNQTFVLPFDDNDPLTQPDFSNMKIVHFDNGIFSNPQHFAVGGRNNSNNDSSENNILISEVHVAICIPKVCTSREFTDRRIVNLSAIGFQYEEQFCRLPNDKPWVPVDYVAIAIFSVIGLLTIVGTLYDVTHSVVLKKDPKAANIYLRMFSVYTNGRRLMTFTPNANALDCLDGLRCISLMWVIVGHTYPMHNFNVNFAGFIEFLTSGDVVWVTTGLFAVDTFFFMAGLLLVYTTVGKMSGTTLLKRLHLFYLNRLLRMFPLLAAVVLLEASVFHRMVDGPFWVIVARNAERCRTFWWTTLLHVQNYVNPDDICIQHSWYIAIDIQLYIVSPIILFWVLGKNKKVAWFALIAALLAILAASTTFNFMQNMPSTNMQIPRIDEQAFYMNYFYVNTLTRGNPFFVGMIAGYILNIYKGKQIHLNIAFVFVAWLIALAMIASCFYFSYEVMQLDWDSQVGDNLFNSFMRFFWAVGLSWTVFACSKGYGGPINWFLTLSIWKVPARISYAMYLFHYSIMFVVAGMRVMPQYFSQAERIFETFAFLAIALWVAFAATVIIDAPCSMIIKMLMEGGQKKRRPPTEKVENSSPDPSPDKDRSVLENNILIVTSLPKDEMQPKNEPLLENSLDDKNLDMIKNGHVQVENGALLEKADFDSENNSPLQNKDELLDKVEILGESDQKISKF